MQAKRQLRGDLPLERRTFTRNKSASDLMSMSADVNAAKSQSTPFFLVQSLPDQTSLRNNQKIRDRNKSLQNHRKLLDEME